MSGGIVIVCEKGHNIEPKDDNEVMVIDLANKFMRVYCPTCGIWKDIKIMVE